MKSGAFIGILFILILLSLPVAAILGDIAIFMDYFWNNGRLQRTFGGFLWEKSNQYLLLSIPLFILLGEITLRAGLAGQMYSAVAKWLSWLPGGLMHSNVGSSAIFAATSGSSVATAATIGTVAYPEIRNHKYKRNRTSIEFLHIHFGCHHILQTFFHIRYNNLFLFEILWRST